MTTRTFAYTAANIRLPPNASTNVLKGFGFELRPRFRQRFVITGASVFFYTRGRALSLGLG